MPPVRERGMVTAELAVALPAAVLVLVLSLAVFDLVVAQLRCADAARAAARAAGRGEPAAFVGRVAGQAAPGASVSVSRSGGLVTVEVRSRPLRLAGILPTGVRPSARAVAVDESALLAGAAWPRGAPGVSTEWTTAGVDQVSATRRGGSGQRVDLG